MPKVGDQEFDYTPEGIAEAEAYAAETGLRISNAQERSVQSYVDGGRVSEGIVKTGLEQMVSAIPFKKGGKAKK